jgi:hypothetical protein
MKKKVEGKGFKLRMLEVSEHSIQASFVEWCKWKEYSWPWLRNLYAVPNAGKRSFALAARMKREGLKAGVPDMCIAYPSGGWHGLYIEFKKKYGGQTTEQANWFDRLQKAGYRCVICFSLEEAVATVNEYSLYMTKEQKNGDGTVVPKKCSEAV